MGGVIQKTFCCGNKRSSKSNKYFEEEDRNKKKEEDRNKKKEEDRNKMKAEDPSFYHHQPEVQIDQKHMEQLKKFAQDIQNNKETSKALENKKILILFGVTGIGKSTYINYLKKKQLILLNNKVVLQEEDDQEFKIGQSVKAETRKVSFFQMKNIYVCDAPGLADTKGCFQDLINTKNILDAINNSKNFCVALIICPNIQDSKAQFLRQIIISFSKYFEKINKTNWDFHLILNKLDYQQPQSGIRSIIDQLKGLKEDSDSSKNEIEVQLIEKMIQKIESNNGYIIFNPIDQSQLKNHKEKIKNLKYQKCQFNIEEIMSEEQTSQFQFMINQCVCFLIKFINEKICYTETKDIFSNIQIIQKFMKDRKIDQILKKFIDFMEKKIQDSLNQIQLLVNQIQDDSISNIKSFIEKIIAILETNITIQQILQNQDENDDYSECLKTIFFSINDCKDKLSAEIEQSSNYSNIYLMYSKLKQICQDQKLIEPLNQIKQICKIENSNDNYVQIVTENILDKYKQKYNFITELIKEWKIEVSTQELKNNLIFIKQFSNNQNINLYEIIKFENKYDQLEDNFIVILKEFEQSILDNDNFSFEENQDFQEFKNLSIFQEEIKNQNEFIRIFYQSIKECLNNAEIPKIIQKINQHLKSLILKCLTQIFSLENNMDEIFQLMPYIKDLSNLNQQLMEEIKKENIYYSCENKMNKLYFSQNQIFQQLLNETFDEVENIINDEQYNFLDNQILDKISFFSKNLSNLNSISIWIEQFKNNFLNHQKIENKLNSIQVQIQNHNNNNQINEQNQFETETDKKQMVKSLENCPIDDLEEASIKPKFQQIYEKDSYFETFKEKYLFQLKNIKGDNDNNYFICDFQKFKRVQLISYLISCNLKNNLAFPAQDTAFLKFLSVQLIREQSFYVIDFKDLQQLEEQAGKIQNLCLCRKFLSGFMDHIYGLLQLYFSDIDSDEKQQQLQLQKFDKKFLNEMQPLVDRINKNIANQIDKIKKIIKEDLFQSKNYNLIKHFSAKELKIFFDKLKKTLNISGIKLLFEQQTSEYDNYQQQFADELIQLNNSLDQQQKDNQDLSSSLQIFQEFTSELHDHLPKKWELSDGLLYQSILQNIDHQKMVYSLLFQQGKYNQLLEKKDYIQDQNLLNYINHKFEILIEQFQNEFKLLSQDKEQQFSTQTLETILEKIDKCQKLFSQFKDGQYYTQGMQIKASYKDLTLKLIKFQFEQFEKQKQKQIQSVSKDLIKKIIKFEYFYEEKTLVSYLESQIEKVLPKIEQEIDLYSKPEGYKIGKIDQINKIQQFLKELNVNTNNRIEKSICTISEKLKSILDKLILFILYAKEGLYKENMNKIIVKALKAEFKFLKFNDIQRNEICSKNQNIIQQQLSTLQNLFEEKNFTKLEKNLKGLGVESSALIEQQMIGFLIDLETQIFNIYFESNNFQEIQKVYQGIGLLSQLNFFKKSDTLKKEHEKIKKRFDGEINSFLNQIINFKEENDFQKCLENVCKLIHFNEIKDIHTQKYQIADKLYDKLSKPIQNFYEEIQNQMDQLKGEDLLVNLKLLQSINQMTFFINNQSKNIFQIFNQLCSNSLNKEKDEINTYSKQLQNLDRTFQQFKVSQEKKLTQKTQEYFRNGKYEQIIQLHFTYDLFCQKVKDLIEFDERIVVKEVEKCYDFIKKNTKQYFNHFSYYLNNIVIQEKELQILEDNFSNISTKINIEIMDTIY